MLVQIIEDALFSAIAAIGFAAVSRPPRRAYSYCALLAAVGHSVRYMLMESPCLQMDMVMACFVASFLIGTLAVFISRYARMPAETCFFPSLLPMVPGVYAYRSFGGLAMCLMHPEEESFNHYFYLFAQNGLVCGAVLLGIVVGATLPVFIFRKISFRATRDKSAMNA